MDAASQQMSDNILGSLALDENFGTAPLPEGKLESKQIVEIVNDILKQTPPGIRADYAVAHHRDFMLLYPRLFRAVTSTDDDFDTKFLSHMLDLIDNQNNTIEESEKQIQDELNEKYLKDKFPTICGKRSRYS